MRRISRLFVLSLLALQAVATVADEPNLTQYGLYGGYDSQNVEVQPVLPTSAEPAKPEYTLAGYHASDRPVAYAPTAYSTVNCGGFYAAADYLYWRPTNSTTPFAGTLIRPTAGTTSNGLPVIVGTSFTSQMLETSFDRDSAFRVNLGYQFRNRWFTGFRYTFFSADGTTTLGNAAVDSDNVLANRLDRNLADDILDSSFDDGEADFAAQTLGLDYNTYDWEIGRYANFGSNRVKLKLLSGVRFADIEQTSLINYRSLEGATTLIADTSENIGMSAWGIRSGFEANYAVGPCFSLFTRSSASMLYADFTATRTDRQQSAAAVGLRSITNKINAFVPVTELSVGSRFHRGNLSAALGYDITHWFNMVQTIDAIHQEDVDGTANAYRYDRGTLSFDGLLAELSYRY